MKTFDENLLLTDEQAAKIIGLKVATLQYWRTKGDGPVFMKVGPKCVRYRLADINEWLDSRRYRSTSEYEASRSL